MNWKLLAAAMCVLAAVACSSDDSASSPTPATSSESTQPTSSATNAPNALPTAGTPEDTLVCGSPDGLEAKGDGFYNKTFPYLMLGGGSMSTDPLTLAGQLRALSTIGASGSGTEMGRQPSMRQVPRCARR